MRVGHPRRPTTVRGTGRSPFPTKAMVRQASTRIIHSPGSAIQRAPRKPDAQARVGRFQSLACASGLNGAVNNPRLALGRLQRSDRQIAVKRLVAPQDEELDGTDGVEVGPVEDIGHVLQRDRLPDVHADQTSPRRMPWLAAGLSPRTANTARPPRYCVWNCWRNSSAGMGFNSSPSSSQDGLRRRRGLGQLDGEVQGLLTAVDGQRAVAVRRPYPASPAGSPAAVGPRSRRRP